MIHGIGVDLVRVSRIEGLLRRHGQRLLDDVLTPAERAACSANPAPGRFLARCLAAKEALGKALGTGIRAPVSLQSIEIIGATDGRPEFTFYGPLADDIRRRGLRFQLAISAATDQILASVIAEAG